MNVEKIKNSFKYRQPILKKELKHILSISNQNTLNQTISYMVAFDLLKRLENGIYYIPDSNPKFANLKPSLYDVINKKYLSNYSGFRAGSYLFYKYKFTTQLSEYYEILSNNVSKNTRSKKEYNGKVIVSYPKFRINKDNILYHEFLELIRNIKLSDNNQDNIKKLYIVYKSMKLNKEMLKKYSKYYKGKRLASVHKLVDKVIDYELA